MESGVDRVSDCMHGSRCSGVQQARGTHKRDPGSVPELDRRKEVRFSRSISSASGTSLKLSGHGRSPVAPFMPHTCRRHIAHM